MKDILQIKMDEDNNLQVVANTKDLDKEELYLLLSILKYIYRNVINILYPAEEEEDENQNI